MARQFFALAKARPSSAASFAGSSLTGSCFTMVGVGAARGEEEDGARSAYSFAHAICLACFLVEHGSDDADANIASPAATAEAVATKEIEAESRTFGAYSISTAKFEVCAVSYNNDTVLADAGIIVLVAGRA